MREHSPRIEVCADGFLATCTAGDWNPFEPFLTKERARAAYVEHVLKSASVPDEWKSSIVVEADQRQEEQELHDLIRMLVATTLAPLSGGDDKDHDFTFDSDGDGWNDPEQDWYECICGDFQIRWEQRDPERSDRPDPVEAALAWRRHVLDTWPENEEELDNVGEGAGA